VGQGLKSPLTIIQQDATGFYLDNSSIVNYSDDMNVMIKLLGTAVAYGMRRKL
jgi:hypothetical protein